MSSYSLSVFIAFYFFVVISGENNTGLINDYEDEINRRLEFLEFCRAINLNVSAYSDSEKNAISVSFELDDPKFKDCCTHYDIFLEKRRRPVEAVKIKYIYGEGKIAAHVFQNVSCGVYELVIQPCYNDWQCYPKKIRYPKSLNVSSNECLFSLEALSNKLIRNESIDGNIIILVSVLSAVSVISVVGLVYYYFSSVRKRNQKGKNESCENGRSNNDHVNPVVDEVVNPNIETTERKVCLYIFHYYDQVGKLKNQVRILRDFLSNFSCFSAIKEIHDELASIHPNPKEWLNSILDREAKDGSIIKFIIIDFEEDFEDGGRYRFENTVFHEIIDAIDNDRFLSLLGYDYLFVVRLNDVKQYLKRNFVRRKRYYIDNAHHLEELCINLCSGTRFNDHEIEVRVRELFQA